MSALSRLAVSQDGIVFDPMTGESYVANSTALFLLRSLQDGQTPSQLEDNFVTRYALTRDKARSDIDELVGQLRSMRLV